MEDLVSKVDVIELAKCECDKESLFHTSSGGISKQMRKEIEDLLAKEDYNWLNDDTFDHAVARILAVTVFNNQIEDDPKAKEESLKKLHNKGWKNEEFAVEWRDNMITAKQLADAIKTYLYHDTEIVDTIFKILQCPFRKGFDRDGVYGPFNQYNPSYVSKGIRRDVEHFCKQSDHELSCFLGGLNSAWRNHLKTYNPYRDGHLSGGAPREEVLLSEFKHLRKLIRETEEARKNPEFWSTLQKRLLNKWEEK